MLVLTFWNSGLLLHVLSVNTSKGTRFVATDTTGACSTLSGADCVSWPGERTTTELTSESVKARQYFSLMKYLCV